MQESQRGAVMSALGKGKSGKKSGKVSAMHIRRAEGGGFIAEHHMAPGKDGAASAPAEHIMPDMASLQQHLQSSMGDQPAAGMAPGAAPDQGAAPPEPGE